MIDHKSVVWGQKLKQVAMSFLLARKCHEIPFIYINVPARLLRSANDPSCLVVPRTRTAIGDRAFAACAPRLWNSLPSHLQSANSLYTFKKHLKTYIFKQTFKL